MGFPFPSIITTFLLPQDLLSIVASVLHLGNIHFAADEESNAQVTTENQLKYITRVRVVGRGQETAAGAGGLHLHCAQSPWQLLGVEGSTLREALTHRKIIAKGEEVSQAFVTAGRFRCSKEAPIPIILPPPVLLSGPLSSAGGI